MSDRIYIRGFPSVFTHNDLKRRFREFGKVRRAYIKVNESTPSLYCGFIRFYDPTAVAQALTLNNTIEGPIRWYVACAQDKAKREKLKKTACPQKEAQRMKTNLVLKNLPTGFLNENLCELLAPFGPILSTSVREQQGHALGFVEFADKQHANTARTELKGKTIGEHTIQLTPWIPKHYLAPWIQELKRARTQFKATQSKTRPKPPFKWILKNK